MMKLFISIIFSMSSFAIGVIPFQQDQRCMLPPSALAASSMPAGACGDSSMLPPTMPITGNPCVSDFSMNPTMYCRPRTQNFHCIHCNMYQPFQPQFNLARQGFPWYHQYAQYRWPNYNRPFTGSPHYADHHFYNGPGNGNVSIGKPNVYIHGTLLGRQRLQIIMRNKSDLLAAAPVHSKDGWVFEKENKKLKVHGAKYDYFYYDFLAHDHHFQNKEGFCGDKKYLYERMVGILFEMGFKKNEVKDFEDYWSVKFPGGKFCVYPQSHAELQKLAEWNGSFMPSGFKRVVFIGVPQLEKIISKHFSSKPEKDWNPVKGIYRVPASKNDISIHEWGVAFLTDKK